MTTPHDPAPFDRASGTGDLPREQVPAPAREDLRSERAAAPLEDRAPAPAPERTAPRTRIEVEDVPAAGGRTGGIWVSLILGAIVLILLLIFIIQNGGRTAFTYLSWDFALPLGVAMLLAAIAGALVMGLVGSVRIFQQGRTIKKLRRQLETIQHALDR